MRILLLLVLSFYSFTAPTDFSECKGKEANYYVAKITWLQASKMHQKFYFRHYGRTHDAVSKK